MPAIIDAVQHRAWSGSLLWPTCREEAPLDRVVRAMGVHAALRALAGSA